MGSLSVGQDVGVLEDLDVGGDNSARFYCRVREVDEDGGECGTRLGQPETPLITKIRRDIIIIIIATAYLGSGTRAGQPPTPLIAEIRWENIFINIRRDDDFLSQSGRRRRCRTCREGRKCTCWLFFSIVQEGGCAYPIASKP